MAYIDQHACPKRHEKCLKHCFVAGDDCYSCQYRYSCCSEYCVFEKGSVIAAIQEDNTGKLADALIPLILEGKLSLEDLARGKETV